MRCCRHRLLRPRRSLLRRRGRRSRRCPKYHLVSRASLAICHAPPAPVVPNLLGLSIIDVVEGTALSALPHMRSVLASIPPSFNSLSEAVAWSTSSGRIRNADSAAVSIPPQLVKSNSKFVWRELPSPCHAPPPSRSSGAFLPSNPSLTPPARHRLVCI